MATEQQQRNKQIMAMVCDHVADVLQRDLEGDERVMKEVWEQLGSDEEDEIARMTLRNIIGHLRGA